MEVKVKVKEGGVKEKVKVKGKSAHPEFPANANHEVFLIVQR